MNKDYLHCRSCSTCDFYKEAFGSAKLKSIQFVIGDDENAGSYSCSVDKEKKCSEVIGLNMQARILFTVNRLEKGAGIKGIR